ncbi:MAG: hypothetical protein Q8P44_02560, partial [Dehalococcoidia bacterium]|nr:hypothetical protein [Dehalococcoidia bacterium]
LMICLKNLSPTRIQNPQVNKTAISFAIFLTSSFYLCHSGLPAGRQAYPESDSGCDRSVSTLPE